MHLSHIHQLLIPPPAQQSKVHHRVWLGLSLAIAFGYGFAVFHQGASTAYAMQDDARQHVFWMWRFIDPTVFPDDLIADYFQSVAPTGYTWVYRTAAHLGIPPLEFSRMLPIILGMAIAAYTYGVGYLLLPVPLAGFMGSTLLLQNLWLHGDLASGVARHFGYAILMAFLYYLLKRSLFPCLITLVVQTLFYPQFIFLMSGILVLRLVQWQRGITLSGDRWDYWMTGLGLGTVFFAMLPFVLESSTYGPLVSVDLAQAMPEFAKQGRNRFFVEGIRDFWIFGNRTGIYRPLLPVSLVGALIFPGLLALPQRFPLGRYVKQVAVLWHLGWVSVGMFFAAHLLLFRLYLPSRYTHYSWQIIASLATGLTIAIALDALVRWAIHWPRWASVGTVATVGLLTVGVVGISHLHYGLPRDSYVVGEERPVYEFLAQQPRGTMVAALSLEADNIAFLTQRSVLTSREHAIPYHLGYYQQIQKRTRDLLQAQYSDNLSMVQQFIRTYGIDYWLSDRQFEHTPLVKNDVFSRWLQQYQPTFDQVVQRLENDTQPILTTLKPTCIVLETERHTLWDADCILQQS